MTFSRETQRLQAESGKCRVPTEHPYHQKVARVGQGKQATVRRHERRDETDDQGTDYIDQDGPPWKRLTE